MRNQTTSSAMQMEEIGFEKNGKNGIQIQSCRKLAKKFLVPDLADGIQESTLSYHSIP